MATGDLLGGLTCFVSGDDVGNSPVAEEAFVARFSAIVGRLGWTTW